MRRLAVPLLVIGGLWLVVVLWFAGGNGDDEAPGGDADAAFLDDTATGESSAPGTRSAALRGSADSVVVSGEVRGLQAVRLSGVHGLQADGTLRDARGSAVSARLEAPAEPGSGSEVSLEGQGLRLGVPFLRLRPGEDGRISDDLMHDSRPAGAREVSAEQEVTVKADDGTLVLTGADGTERRAEGPVTLESGSLRYEGDVVTWHDPPVGSVRVAAGWLSWAGDGAVEHRGQSHSGDRLGFRGDGVVTLEIGEQAIGVSGDVGVAQIWRGGLPVVTTSASVELKARPRPASPGQTVSFTWAPRNDGPYDMAMTRIRPGSDAGAWCELALDPLPDMDGGTDEPRRGGDTDGLIFDEGGFLDRGTQRISSMIRPGSGDERTVDVRVPASARPGEHTIVLVVEGNFDPVRVEVPITVSS